MSFSPRAYHASLTKTETPLTAPKGNVLQPGVRFAAVESPNKRKDNNEAPRPFTSQRMYPLSKGIWPAPVGRSNSRKDAKNLTSCSTYLCIPDMIEPNSSITLTIWAALPWHRTKACRLQYLLEDDVVEVEICRWCISNKRLFIADCAICWIKSCIINALHETCITLSLPLCLLK
jgi:hypothetical protein